MIEVCGGGGCVGGGAMRSRSEGTAGGYSRGGRWKVSASCAVTCVSTNTTAIDPSCRGVCYVRCGYPSSRRPVGAREATRMPNIAVTPEQLQSVAGQLNAGAANIESTLSQLASQVAPLQSEWQGVAQARFQELWAEWQRSSRGIQEALHGISQLTQQAAANYGDTEQAIASSFTR